MPRTGLTPASTAEAIPSGILAMPDVRPAAIALFSIRGNGRVRARATASFRRSLRPRSGSSTRSAWPASFTVATLLHEGAMILREATIFGEYSLLVNQWLVCRWGMAWDQPPAGQS